MNNVKLAGELVALAKSLVGASGYSGIIEELVEDIGVDAVEDTGEFNGVDVHTYGMRNNRFDAEGILYISQLESSGAGAPGGSQVNSVVQKVIERADKEVYDYLKRKYPTEMDGISFQDMTYDAMEEVGLESEFEDVEVDKFSDDDYLVVSVGAMLDEEPDEYHHGVGKVTAMASVTLGSPGKNIFFVEESVDFTDERSLKKNLTRALKTVGGKL